MARRRPTLALLAAALASGRRAGCGSGSSTPDSEIVKALDLKQAGQGYEIGGDPFCAVDELLNDGDEVDGAGGEEGRASRSRARTGRSASWHAGRSPRTARSGPRTI